MQRPQLHGQADDAIEEGKIDPSFVITHRCGLEDGPKMYETFKKKQDGCIKVVMKPHAHI